MKRKTVQEKELQVPNKKERKKVADLSRPVKVTAVTTASAGVGVMSAVAAVTIAATFEIALPAALCLWAGGITCGAIGLALGIGKKKKSD